MKRLQVFPWGEKLAAVGRRPLAVWMAGFLVLAWLPSATAEQAEKRLVVPEPIAAPAGESALQDPRLLDPEPPKNSERPAADHGYMVPEPQEDDAQSDPEPPRNRKRSAADHGYMVPGPQADDVEPSADGPYAEEDDDAGEDRRRYRDRSWGPGSCWQPFANRLEARGEWLLWWGKGNYLPALVTTGPSTTNQAEAGALGSSGTSILFGDSEVNDVARSGVRLTLDYWLTCDHCLGLEAQYFGLGDDTASFQADSNGFPVLARPFFNAQTGASQPHSIGYPGAQTGTVSVAATTDFQGVEALLRRTLYCGCDAHLDLLVGYRYLRLSDDLGIDEVDTFINPVGTVPVNSKLALSDRFSTLNEFQGADLGVASDWHYNRWDLGFLLKVGLGNTSSRVSIGGSNVVTEPTQAPVTSPGGFLAQASNSGQYQRNQFTMVPELGINVGFDLTPRLRLVGGYSLIY